MKLCSASEERVENTLGNTGERMIEGKVRIRRRRASHESQIGPI
jgi:hypothetical protein